MSESEPGLNLNQYLTFSLHTVCVDDTRALASACSLLELQNYPFHKINGCVQVSVLSELSLPGDE